MQKPFIWLGHKIFIELNSAISNFLNSGPTKCLLRKVFIDEKGKRVR